MIEKQPKASQRDEQIKTTWCMHTQWNTTQPQKRKKVCHLQQREWTLKILL